MGPRAGLPPARPARLFHRVYTWSLWLAVWSVSACSSEPGPETSLRATRPGQDRAGGDVIATVHGHGISSEAVRDLAREASVPPDVALAALEDLELLSLEAERAGYADDDAVQRAVEKAMVQALLRLEVERPVAEAYDAESGEGTAVKAGTATENGDESSAPASSGSTPEIDPRVLAQNRRLKALVDELEDKHTIERDERAIDEVMRATGSEAR